MMDLSLLSALGLLVAAAVLLWQLVHGRRLAASMTGASGRRWPSLPGALAATLAVALAGANLALWLDVRARAHANPVADDTPAARADVTSAAPIDHGADMQTAIAKLAAKLREHPEDAEGWVLLGRTYNALQRPAEAREAFRHALAAAPNDPDIARESADQNSDHGRETGGDPLSIQEITAVGLPSAPHDSEKSKAPLGTTSLAPRNP
ncbi:MAG TPA: tetratricopeptide repeat protein [Steroidobacteraceae bacterium]|nr:tetratricopeptide repeat protein [Steroidobacteraceae bacterium]